MERYTEDLAEFCPPSTSRLGEVVNEAFGSGRTAVVCEACGSAGHLIKVWETSYVVPVGDLETLILRESLAWDGELRATLTAKAASRLQEWSPGPNVDALAAILSDVAKGGSL